MIELVEKTLDKHTGGKEFFENLDRYVGNRPGLYRWACATAYHLFGQTKYVVSGSWGREFRDLCDPTAIVLPGGIGDLYHMGKLPQAIVDPDSKYVFLDNSYYSGATYAAAKSIVAPAKVLGAVVIYDGASVADQGVYSLYRWRDR